jgi:hypothetical protein
MRPHPSTLALLLLAALGVGYLAGSSGGRAQADPVLQTSVSGTYLTQDAAGTTLTFWSLRDGRPVSATTYYLSSFNGMVGGKSATTRQLVVHPFTPEPVTEEVK